MISCMTWHYTGGTLRHQNIGTCIWSKKREIESNTATTNTQPRKGVVLGIGQKWPTFFRGNFHKKFWIFFNESFSVNVEDIAAYDDPRIFTFGPLQAKQQHFKHGKCLSRHPSGQVWSVNNKTQSIIWRHQTEPQCENCPDGCRSKQISCLEYCHSARSGPNLKM